MKMRYNTNITLRSLSYVDTNNDTLSGRHLSSFRHKYKFYNGDCTNIGVYDHYTGYYYAYRGSTLPLITHKITSSLSEQARSQISLKSNKIIKR